MKVSLAPDPGLLSARAPGPQVAHAGPTIPLLPGKEAGGSFSWARAQCRRPGVRGGSPAGHHARRTELEFISKADSLAFFLGWRLGSFPRTGAPSMLTRPLHVALERSGRLDITYPPRAHANLAEGSGRCGCDQGPGGGTASRRCLQRNDAGRGD